MSRRYPEGMRFRPSFAFFSALLLIASGEAQAQVRATATAAARIVERPVRIVAAELRQGAPRLPPQAHLSVRSCDAPAPPGCRLLVIELP
jgi:hypothetical protein